MFFNRGSAGDYDAWEKLGNPGWGWNGLLPYFKKVGSLPLHHQSKTNMTLILRGLQSETFSPPSQGIADEFPGIISSDSSAYGSKGPVGSSFSTFQYPIMSKNLKSSLQYPSILRAKYPATLSLTVTLIENFFRGWNSVGVTTQPQPNAGDANGAFYSTVSLKARNQSRSDASDAYYRPIARSRDNFHLVTGHTVTKVNFDRKKKAVSVDVGDSLFTQKLGRRR